MQSKQAITYSEISKAKISATRNLVISDCSKGGFTLAQQMNVVEEGNNGKQKVTTIFLKGAVHIDGVEGLANLRDAINLAIKVSEDADRQAKEDAWDEPIGE